jgi:probable addiction module antidote protein
MEKITVADFDPAEYIETKEDVIANLSVALEDGDVKYIIKIMGDIVRSEGMSKIGRELGVTREGLYKSLAPTGNPSFETVLKLLDLLGFRLKLEQKVST